MTVHAQKLKNIVAGLEQLDQQRADISMEIKSRLLEAKSEGFEPKIIQERKKKPDEVQEENEILELYRAALA